MSSSIESKRANPFNRPGFKAAGVDGNAAPSYSQSPRNASLDSPFEAEQPAEPDASEPSLPYGRAPDEAGLLKQRAAQAMAHDARAAAADREEQDAAAGYSATALGGERYGPLSDVLDEIEAMGRRWGELGGRRGEPDVGGLVAEVEACELGGVSDWAEFSRELEPSEAKAEPEVESFGERLKAALAAEAAAALAARVVAKPAMAPRDLQALSRPLEPEQLPPRPKPVLSASPEEALAHEHRKRPAARFVDDEVDEALGIPAPHFSEDDGFDDPPAATTASAQSELSRAIARAERSVAKSAVQEAVEAAKGESEEKPLIARAAPTQSAASERVDDLFSQFGAPLGASLGLSPLPNWTPVGPSEQLLLGLDVPSQQQAQAGPVITESNRIAVKIAEKPALWPNGFVCLVGPEKCGKSSIAATLHPQAVRLSEADCVDGFLRPEAVVAGRVLVFDDLDQAFASVQQEDGGDRFERAVFHLLNMVHQQGARLLATGREPPSQWRVALPDLRSRLAAAMVGVIEEPDDAMLAALLPSLFDSRGVGVEQPVIDYLVKRMERSYLAAAEIVEKLDAVSLREKRSITTTLAAEALGWRPSRF
ncbi:MAG: hypothetical protein KTR21_09990 [Rhodobacteraceae bacterium]|nr:hypothetical protein [Paracoccaceae bacterium]